MTNLNIFNIFKRISALEAARARADITIDNMKGLLRDQSQWLASLQTTVTKPATKAKPAAKQRKPYTTEKVRAKRAAYARKYYAKKKAESAAKEAV